MTEAELLDAIWQNPDDDAPRLVYADWLQERGDPRGEYIHISCSHSLSGAQTERSSELFKQHGNAWMEPFLRLGVSSVSFARGLPIGLQAEPKVWAEHGATLLRMAPIALVSVKPGPPHSLAAFFVLREFARVRSLDFVEHVEGDACVNEMIQFAHSSHLIRMSFGRTSLRSVAALANWPGLRTVQHLDLSHCHLDSDDAVALAGSRKLSGLLELRLQGNPMGGSGRVLAESTRLNSLVSLDVRNCVLGLEGVTAFLDPRALPTLRELKISGNLGETVERTQARFATQRPHLTVS